MSYKLLAPILLVLSCVCATAARAETRSVSLRAAAKAADVVAVATLLDPGSVQTPIANSGNPAFVRQQWRFRVDSLVKGKKPLPGKVILVDEPAWRLDLAARRACGDASPCGAPPKVRYDTTLSRPPVPGRQVLLLLRQTRDGWALAFEAAMDAPQRAAELKAKGGQ